MSNKNRIKPLPTFRDDDEAERFIDEADLTEYDLSGLQPTGFEFEKKVARVNMQLPQPLLDAVKAVFKPGKTATLHDRAIAIDGVCRF